MVLHFV
jgi:hypothetical protein